MTIVQYDLAVFISDLIRGEYKDSTDLQLAAKLTAMLPDSVSKTELQTQIVKALQKETAVLEALAKVEE